MTDVSLEVLNRRTAVAAVHAEAARIGADGEALLDSQEFFKQATSLDPDAPDYRKQVRDLVASKAPAAQPPRQWTLADVEKSSPAELAEAMNAGLLSDLGYAPPRRKRGRR